MANIAHLLKDEMIRLARRELRRELEGLKKASATYRSEIAALKRRMLVLEKSIKGLGDKRSESKPVSAGDSRVRFSSKGLASQRQRLGLSAAEMGALLNVSSQTIYNWEAGKTQPRREQVVAIAAMRKMGKRRASALLAAIAEQ